MDNTREKLIVLISMVQDNGKRTECTENSIVVWSPSNAELADHLIANGVTLDNQVSSSKWISVKDRLPEPFVDVIAFFGGQEMYVDSVDNKGRWYSSYMYMCDPTYWMPLPQPPKGE